MEQLQEHLGAWVDSPDPGSSDLSGANSATLQLEITRIQSVEPELCGTLDLLKLSTMQLFNAPSCRKGAPTGCVVKGRLAQNLYHSFCQFKHCDE